MWPPSSERVLVGAQHHRDRVPAHERAQPALDRADRRGAAPGGRRGIVLTYGVESPARSARRARARGRATRLEQLAAPARARPRARRRRAPRATRGSPADRGPRASRRHQSRLMRVQCSGGSCVGQLHHCAVPSVVRCQSLRRTTARLLLLYARLVGPRPGQGLAGLELQHDLHGELALRQPAQVDRRLDLLAGELVGGPAVDGDRRARDGVAGRRLEVQGERAPARAGLQCVGARQGDDGRERRGLGRGWLGRGRDRRAAQPAGAPPSSGQTARCRCGRAGGP